MSTLKKYIDYLKANVGTSWTDHAKFAAILAKVMKPETIVDLGVHKGYSTFAFGFYFAQHYSVDEFIKNTIQISIILSVLYFFNLFIN